MTRDESRGFVRQRFVAVQMVVAMGVAFLLVFGLLVLGPVMSGWIGDALDIEGVMGWLWWVAQWPILLVGLLALFATVLYLGPNVDHPRWRFLTPGAVFAVVVWLIASGALRRLHLDVRLLQQDVGILGRRDRDADLALGDGDRTAARG